MSAKCCLTPPTYHSDVAKSQWEQWASLSDVSRNTTWSSKLITLGWTTSRVKCETALDTESSSWVSVFPTYIYVSKLIRYRTYLVETKLIEQEHKWSCEPQKEAALRWPRRRFHWQWLRWRPSVLRPIRPHQMWGWSQAPINGQYLSISFETVGTHLSVLLS